MPPPMAAGDQAGGFVAQIGRQAWSTLIITTARANIFRPTATRPPIPRRPARDDDGDDDDDHLMHSDDDDDVVYHDDPTTQSDDDDDGDIITSYEDAYINGGFGATPASSEAIAGLPEMTAGETRVKECGVCLEAFEEGDRLRKLPCSHGFHESCAFEWLRVSRLCPFCRFALPAETETDSEASGGIRTGETETDSETDGSRDHFVVGIDYYLSID